MKKRALIWNVLAAAVVVAACDQKDRGQRDPKSREPVVLAGHEDSVNSAAFSPDGSQVVTASMDNTARIWPVAGGEPVVLRGHDEGVRSAAFSPDGTRVVTASADKTARI